MDELRCCDELRDRAGESTVAARAIDRRLSIIDSREPGRDEPGSLLAGPGGFIALPVAFGAGIADLDGVAATAGFCVGCSGAMSCSLTNMPKFLAFEIFDVLDGSVIFAPFLVQHDPDPDT